MDKHDLSVIAATLVAVAVIYRVPALQNILTGQTRLKIFGITL